MKKAKLKKLMKQDSALHLEVVVKKNNEITWLKERIEGLENEIKGWNKLGIESDVKEKNEELENTIDVLSRGFGALAESVLKEVEKQPLEFTESEKDLIKTIRANLGSSFDNVIEKSISNGIRISINLWITQK